MSQETPLTGRVRERKTTWAVKFNEKLARILITTGGLGTIFAVMLVCIFLVSVVIPLFGSGKVETAGNVVAVGDEKHKEVIRLLADEHRTCAFAMFDDGQIQVIRTDTGETLQRLNPFESGPKLTSWNFSIVNAQSIFGFSDGTMRSGLVGFESRFVNPSDLPDEVRKIEIGQVTLWEKGLIKRAAEEQYRLCEFVLKLDDPFAVGSDVSVSLIDQSIRPAGPIIATYTSDHKLRIKVRNERRNLMTGKVTVTLTGGEMDIPTREAGEPNFLLLSGIADTVYLAWKDGYVLRIDSRDLNDLKVAEEIDLTPEAGCDLTKLTFMIGKTSLVVGDSKGNVSIWFRTKPKDSKTIDGSQLVKASQFKTSDGTAVTAIAASQRSRTLAIGTAGGSMDVFYVTSGRHIASSTLAANKEAVNTIVMTPKDDGVMAHNATYLFQWNLKAPHPEATVSSIFRPVWYEGYPKAEHVWQSSSGTDDFEPKYGLYPLIFGTIKATFYCMLFGVPIALLAAIYTSEFLKPSIKSSIKPTIELMASLPSVVLGFLAALVFAPMIEDIIPETLALFFTLPFTFLLFSQLWLLLPGSTIIRLNHRRFWFILATIPIALLLASMLGGSIERLFFMGNIKAWLNGQGGSGFGGWLILLAPLSFVVIVAINHIYLTPKLIDRTRGWSRQACVLAYLIKFFISVGLFLVVLSGMALLITVLGIDSRGGVLDTYVQRNALIVGIVMGFAVIPIIYTLSEDALSSVPDHLRAAALGAGATKTQTALRVIIPTAMSGLFSAVMIGFGRAVGETMIVLMAAGNTPVLEWNIFNGFRTLSANIAVELPEAVQNSTHYRMLFLAALTLFVMTFIVNTFAEMVRLRFRKRAFEL